jgi:hypothetical protein
LVYFEKTHPFLQNPIFVFAFFFPHQATAHFTASSTISLILIFFKTHPYLSLVYFEKTHPFLHNPIFLFAFFFFPHQATTHFTASSTISLILIFFKTHPYLFLAYFEKNPSIPCPRDGR